MKLLFVTLSIPDDIKYAGMYVDLATKLATFGHDVTMIGSTNSKTSLRTELGVKILRVKSPKIVGQKNLIKKGIAMGTLHIYYERQYNKYFSNESFDWIIMPTPPITLIDFVAKLTEKLNAKLYLILRDIHPQSSASLGEIKYKWMINYLYKRSEKAYQCSDLIGCMSPSNIEFILKEHPNVSSDKFVILYNWLKDDNNESLTDSSIRERYNLAGKTIVLFGGNIALGQRIENIYDLADHYKNDDKIIFVVIGKGVKKQELVSMIKSASLKNVLFFDFMARKDYVSFVKGVDIGLISINENNAAPTCPSKVIAYMSMQIPVLALINRNSDYGKVYIENPHIGYWAVGNDKQSVYKYFDTLCNNTSLRKQMGDKGRQYYLDHFTDTQAAIELCKQLERIE